MSVLKLVATLVFILSIVYFVRGHSDDNEMSLKFRMSLKFSLMCMIIFVIRGYAWYILDGMVMILFNDLKTWQILFFIIMNIGYVYIARCKEYKNKNIALGFGFIGAMGFLILAFINY